ncbi:hypothetical protein TOPH_00156, partial [Tolypocladium ophioglossoides CBS 100239]
VLCNCAIFRRDRRYLFGACKYRTTPTPGLNHRGCHPCWTNTSTGSSTRQASYLSRYAQTRRALPPSADVAHATARADPLGRVGSVRVKKEKPSIVATHVCPGKPTMKKAVATVPDAWEDDWETQADTAAQQDAQQQTAQAPLTKTERLTQHVETNRRIWESADSPQTFHYLEANSNVPLTSSFKPQVKVLSRKPVIAKKDPVTGMSQLTVDDADDEDKKEVQLTPEEMRAKQKRDREEKQRRYDEARAKIFGESAPSSRGSSPGTVTPPRSDSRHSAQGRGRGRGGGQRSSFDTSSRQQPDMRRQNNQNGPTRELYDPSCSFRPDSTAQRRGAQGDSSTAGPPPRDEPQQPIRAPRGPDGSGRGGMGFTRRGAKES